MIIFMNKLSRIRAPKLSLALLNNVLTAPANGSSQNVRNDRLAFGKHWLHNLNVAFLFQLARFSSVVSSDLEYFPDVSTDITKQNLSRAAVAYLEKAKQYDDMISRARAEYATGMRHLANMMGENPDTFTQADANVDLP